MNSQPRTLGVFRDGHWNGYLNECAICCAAVPADRMNQHMLWRGDIESADGCWTCYTPGERGHTVFADEISARRHAADTYQTAQFMKWGEEVQ